MTAPMRLRVSIFSRWMLCSGVSLGTRVSGRRSLRHTSAARSSRLLEIPWASEAMLFMLAGTRAIPAVG